MAKSNLNSLSIFSSLTRNAIDFMNRSIEELESYPKYSVIHFCSALEIFLKARLLREHWSLLFSHIDRAGQHQFLTGEFLSVSLDETMTRLEGIANEALSREEKESFKTVHNHRNKLIHFFNENYIHIQDEATLYSVVSEQCKAWFYLHKLLTKKWSDYFSSFLAEIEDLNDEMLGHREFLSAKFDAISGQLKLEQARGNTVQECYSCGFNSLVITQRSAPLCDSKCHVCNSDSLCLSAPCPHCGKVNILQWIGEGECEKCHTYIDTAYLLELARKSGDFHETERAYCTQCSYNHAPSVLECENQWICLSCLSTFENITFCDWCNQPLAGEMEDSYITGCVVCQGQLGNDNS